jgi:hypothetical protein
MPLGDSLTGFPEGYRGPLYRALRAAGLNVDFVGSRQWEPVGGGDPDNEGWGGYRIGPDDFKDPDGNPGNLDFYIEKWLAAAKPHVIILSIGANDIGAGGAISDAAPQKFTAFVRKIRRLAPQAQVLLADVPPGAGSINGHPVVDAYNANVKATASIDGVRYLDSYRGLIGAGFDPGSDTTDGQHFSETGGKKYANVLFPGVAEAVKSVRC